MIIPDLFFKDPININGKNSHYHKNVDAEVKTVGLLIQERHKQIMVPFHNISHWVVPEGNAGK